MNTNIRFVSIFLITALQLICLKLGAGEWGTAAPLNTPRSGASAVVLNGYIYVMGGKTANGVILNTVERFDPASGTWDAASVAPFDRPRFNAAATVYNGKIYIIGGHDDENEVLKKAEAYNPSSNSWYEIRQMDNHREMHVAVLLQDEICVMGGRDEYGNSLAMIEWYDSNYDEWYPAPSTLNEPKQSPFALSVADTVFIFGGFTPFPTISCYKGVADPGWIFTWSALPSLQTGRGYGATAQLGDSIFMMGGRTLNDTTDAVEVFNLHTQQLEPGLSLLSVRAGMAAVTLNNEIYVIGGVSTQNQPLALVEVYSEVTGIVPLLPSVPHNFAQISGYPNPFNGVIQLKVNIPQTGNNQISVYDVWGRKVKSIYSGNLATGTHTFLWEGKDAQNLPAATGIYFAVLKGSGYLQSFKIVYVR